MKVLTSMGSSRKFFAHDVLVNGELIGSLKNESEDAYGEEEINKAIGGEAFCPWLAELKDDIEPDYISVAYGTNHWHRSSSEEFRVICEEFYDKLVANYPNAKIFALTPI